MTTPTPPEKHRERSPSLNDVWDAVTETHRFESQPPLAKFIDYYVMLRVRRALRWVWRTKGGTISALVSGAVTSAVTSETWHPLAHFWAWLKHLAGH